MHELRLFPPRISVYATNFVSIVLSIEAVRSEDSRSVSRPCQDPHEQQLHHIRVEEQELRPLVALRPHVARLDGSGRSVSTFGKENVF